MVILNSLECIGIAEECKSGLRSVPSRSASVATSEPSFNHAMAEYTYESTLKCPPEQFQSLFLCAMLNFFIFVFSAKIMTEAYSVHSSGVYWTLILSEKIQKIFQASTHSRTLHFFTFPHTISQLQGRFRVSSKPDWFSFSRSMNYHSPG